MTEMAVSGQVTITVLQNVLLHLIVFAQDVQCNCCSAKCSVLFFSYLSQGEYSWSKPISVSYNWPHQMIVALNVNLVFPELIFGATAATGGRVIFL